MTFMRSLCRVITLTIILYKMYQPRNIIPPPPIWNRGVGGGGWRASLHREGTISAGLGIWCRQLPGSGDSQPRRESYQGRISRSPPEWISQLKLTKYGKHTNPRHHEY